MNATQNATQNIIKRWEAFNAVAQPYLAPITNEAEYETAETLLDEITDRMTTPDDPRYITLFRVLAERIKIWEDNNETIPESSPAELLAYLMEEHDLKQTDLEALVDQSTLSKILRNERAISKRLAKALGERFHVSPAVFL
jgi:HTH-type transcriptional regulator / antitoxin HigA